MKERRFFGDGERNKRKARTKGRQVYVEGRLRTRQYETKDGNGSRCRTEIVALRVRLLGNRASSTQAREEGSEKIQVARGEGR